MARASTEPPVLDTALTTLVSALAAHSGALVARIRDELRTRFVSYEAMATETIDAQIEVSLGYALAYSRPGHDSGAEAAAIAAMAEIGAEEADHGIPVDDLLGVWRIGLQIVVAKARELAHELGLGDAVVLDFAESVLTWSDRAMGASALAHRQSELETFRRDHERRSAFVVGVLTGGLGVAAVRRQASAHAVELQREYLAIRARPAPGVAAWELERELGFHAAASHRPGLHARLDGDIVGFLAELPAGVSKGTVGVGPPRTPERLAESHRLASRALTTADSFHLTGIHSLQSLGVRPAIVADRDVAEALHARYLAPVLATGTGSELCDSVRAWLDHGMHVESAAERLHVHPNTLRYRIARFEELIGTSLREMTTALEVWWAIQAQSALTQPESDD